MRFGDGGEAVELAIGLKFRAVLGEGETEIGLGEVGEYGGSVGEFVGEQGGGGVVL